jgi:very-short-patch-repair endonuclease
MSLLEDELAWGLRAAGIIPPEREYVFAEGRRFRFDFAWPRQRLAVEVDGGLWIGGRHVRPAAVEVECEKSALAAINGWRVIHVAARHIQRGEAITWIEHALRA